MKRKSLLQTEIKQDRGVSSISQEMTLSLFRTTDVIRRYFSSIVEKQKISLQQYNVLRILRGAKGELPTLEIAARMVEETPGITRLLDKLVAGKLVERRRCEEDRRQVLCQISQAGLNLLTSLDEEITSAENWANIHIAEKDLNKLVSLLESVRQVYSSTSAEQE